MSLKRQRGAGLIEALVSILVLSVGILGMMGMQTASIKFEQTGWTRSALVASISSLSDRIRSNIDAPDTAYSFSDSYADERAAIDASTTYLAPAVNCNTTACTAAQLAAYDLVVWRQDLNNQLPGAVGFVTPTGTKGVDLRFQITVAWFNKDRVNGATLESPVACTAASTGQEARNCCPATVGNVGDLAGVQCVNMEMIP